MNRRQAVKVTLISFLLVVAALALYQPVTGFDFTNYDDTHYVTENTYVREGLSWKGMAWALANVRTVNWHPLTWLSHMADWQVYQSWAGGHHLTNVFLHAVNGAILFLLFRCLTGATWRSAMVGACFALHPMHVESVAWVAERKDVLSAWFGLLSLWAYAHHVRQSRSTAQGERFGTWYWVSLGTFASGLMSKAMLVTWPCVMLLLDYWPLGRFQPSGLSPKAATTRRGIDIGNLATLIKEKLPFFFIAAAACLLTVISQKAEGAIAPLSQVPWEARIGNAVVAYLQYLLKWVWPSNLAVIYPYVRHWPLGTVLAAGSALVLITLMVFWQGERRPYLLVGWLWYVGTLVPVIGLVQVGNQSMADRYMYLPSIGVLIMIAWGAGELVGSYKPGRLLAGIAVAGALLACAMVARTQLWYWRNSESLFQHAAAVTRNNLVAYNSLGFYYDEQGDSTQARKYFEKALAVDPENAVSWGGLARVLLGAGKTEDAIACAQKAAALNPGLAEAQTALGQALLKQGHLNEATAHYAEAVRLRPNSAPAHYNLANALARRGQFGPAKEHYLKALALDPGSADAHNNLGFLLSREGRPDQAVPHFKLALRLQNKYWQARYGLGDALARLGQYQEAIRELILVTRQMPDFVEGLNRLAWILATNEDARFRDSSQAVPLAEHACQLTNHKEPFLLRTLAAAYAEAGRFPEAAHVAEEARDQAQNAGQQQLGSKMQELAEQFRAGRPMREGNADRLP